MPTAKKSDDAPTEEVESLDLPADAPTEVATSTRWRFTYLDTTVYPALGVTAEFGDVHDWPDGPPNDGRWTLAAEGE